MTRCATKGCVERPVLTLPSGVRICQECFHTGVLTDGLPVQVNHQRKEPT